MGLDVHEQFSLLSGEIVLLSLRRWGPDVAWIIGGQAITFLGAFGGIKLLTMTMGPETYGKLVLGLSIAGTISLFSYGPLGSAATRLFSIYSEREELSSYFYALILIHCCLAFLLIISIFVVWGFGDWLALVGIWHWLAILSILLAMVNGILFTLISILNASLARRQVAINQALDAIGRPTLALVSLHRFGLSGESALAGYFGGGILILVLGVWSVIQNLKLGRESRSFSGQIEITQCLKSFIAYSWPLVLWAGVSAISSFGDRWIVQAYLGLKQVGIYAAIGQVANAPVTVLSNVFSQFALPVAFRRAGELKNPDSIRESFQFVDSISALFLCLGAPFIVLFFFFGTKITILLTSKAFADDMGILWLIALGAVLFQYGQLLATKGLILKETGKYLLPKVVQGIVFLLGAVILVGPWGLTGIAASYVVSASVHGMLIMIVNRSMSAYVRE